MAARAGQLVKHLAPSTRSFMAISVVHAAQLHKMAAWNSCRWFWVPSFSTGLIVREIYGNGFVYQIDALDLAGRSHLAWAGTDPAQAIPARVRDNGWTFASVAYGGSGTWLGQYLVNGDKAWIMIDIAGVAQASHEGLAGDAWPVCMRDASTQLMAALDLWSTKVFENDVINNGELCDIVSLEHATGKDMLFEWARADSLVAGIRVYVDSDHNPRAREEIDSIQLQGDLPVAPGPLALFGSGVTLARNRKLGKRIQIGQAANKNRSHSNPMPSALAIDVAD